MGATSGDYSAVYYNGVRMTQEVVDGLNEHNIHDLKENGQKNKYIRSANIGGTMLLVAGGAQLLLGAAVLLFGENKAHACDLVVSAGAELLTGALAKNYGRTQNKKNKELDVLNYLKSGDLTQVKFKDTQEKAINSGLRIGPQSTI